MTMTTRQGGEFHEVMGWVGRFLSQWGQLEQLLESIKPRNSGKTSVSARLDVAFSALGEATLSSANKDAILADLEKISRSRNLIAHGLIGGGVSGDEARIVCRTSFSGGKADEQVIISVAELMDGCRKLSRVIQVLQSPMRLIAWPDQFR